MTTYVRKYLIHTDHKWNPQGYSLNNHEGRRNFANYKKVKYNWSLIFKRCTVDKKLLIHRHSQSLILKYSLM